MATILESALGFLPGSKVDADFSNMFSLNLKDDLRKHLYDVYFLLGGTLLAAAFGVFVESKIQLNGLLTSIASIGLLIYISMTRTQGSTSARLGALGVFGLLTGASTTPLIRAVVQVDPSIPLTAFALTCLIFASFAFVALKANHSRFLYLGGFLSSALLGMVVLGFASWLFPSLRYIDYIVSLYGGLLVFCGYVVYDTQLIIAKHNLGETDVVTHAVELFLDFVNIFVRLLIILAELSDNKEKRKKDKEGRTERR